MNQGLKYRPTTCTNAHTRNERNVVMRATENMGREETESENFTKKKSE